MSKEYVHVMKYASKAKSEVGSLISLYNELAADLRQPEFSPVNPENNVNQLHDLPQGNCV